MALKSLVYVRIQHLLCQLHLLAAQARWPGTAFPVVATSVKRAGHWGGKRSVLPSLDALKRPCKQLGCFLVAVVVATLLGLVPLNIARASGSGIGCDGALEKTAVGSSNPRTRSVLAATSGWTVRERIGHLFVLGVNGTTVSEALRERIERTNPAGVVLLGRNVQSQAQLVELVTSITAVGIRMTSGVAPFVATDFEGGSVNALRTVTGPTPSAAQLGAGGEAVVAARAVADASVLRALGINVNLAPVADIRPSTGGFIGTRAFSGAPIAVSSMVDAYAHGLASGGIVPVVKHFPGHGAAIGDSHTELPILAHDRATLFANDLAPFRTAVQSGDAGMIMVGHLLVPAIDSQTPASLSGAVINGLLRGDLGYTGTVVTDELKMRAVSEKYTVEKAAILAIDAGNDLILADYTSAEHERVIEALVARCSEGLLQGERVAASLARTLLLKDRYGLLTDMIGRRVGAYQAEATLGAVALDPVGIGGAEGRLFPDAPEGGGFTITNEQGIMFYRDFVDLGGGKVLGRPLSRRFALGTEVVQVLEAGLLRWLPDEGASDLFVGEELFLATQTAPDTVELWRRQFEWGDGSSADQRAELPEVDARLGLSLGVATASDRWVVRRYQRGLARVPLATSGPREVVSFGEIAVALRLFPPDATQLLDLSGAPVQ